MILKVFRSGSLQTNTYLVGDKRLREALVIDPVCNVQRLLAFIAAADYRVVAIVNTHGHFDHVSGNRALKEATGAPIMIHRADVRLAGRASSLARFVCEVAEDSPPADILLESGSKVPCGDLAFRVIHTPGHTPGGITLDGQGSLFCGDLIIDGVIGKTELPGCSEALLRESIRRLLRNRPIGTRIYPGHGPAITMGAAGDFLKTMEL